MHTETADDLWSWMQREFSALGMACHKDSFLPLLAQPEVDAVYRQSRGVCKTTCAEGDGGHVLSAEPRAVGHGGDSAFLCAQV